MLDNIQFTKADRKLLKQILKARRDIRGNNFIDKKISKKKIKQIIKAASYAPSVGYSQPWHFIIIKNKKIKYKIYKNFQKEYKKSQKHFQNKPIYNRLKLEGIIETPINIAVYCKKSKNPILGTTSQKHMQQYSVVCAIQNMWLMARTLNIGIGWVSILNHKKINKILNIKKGYKLIGYLCIGYTKQFSNIPELKKLKWEKQKKYSTFTSKLT